MRYVALKIPLGLLDIGRLAEGHQPHTAWIQRLGDPLDHAAFTGSVTALENDDKALASLLDPVLQTHQFKLEAFQFLFIIRPCQLPGRLVRLVATICYRMRCLALAA